MRRLPLLLALLCLPISGCETFKHGLVEVFNLREQVTPVERQELDVAKKTIEESSKHSANVGAVAKNLPKDPRSEVIVAEADRLTTLTKPTLETTKEAEKLAKRVEGVVAKQNPNPVPGETEEQRKARLERERREAQTDLQNLLEDLAKADGAIVAIQNSAQAVEAKKDTTIQDSAKTIATQAQTISTLQKQVEDNDASVLIWIWAGVGALLCVSAAVVTIARVYLPLIPVWSPVVLFAAGVGMGSMAKLYSWKGFPYLASAILVAACIAIYFAFKTGKDDLKSKKEAKVVEGEVTAALATAPLPKEVLDHLVQNLSPSVISKVLPQ